MDSFDEEADNLDELHEKLRDKLPVGQVTGVSTQILVNGAVVWQGEIRAWKMRIDFPE